MNWIWLIIICVSKVDDKFNVSYIYLANKTGLGLFLLIFFVNTYTEIK